MGAVRDVMDYFGLAEPEAEDGAEYQEVTPPPASEVEPAVAEKPSFTSAKMLSAKTKLSKPATSSVTKFPVREVAPSPASDLRRIVTVTPNTYNEAKEIGDAFRDGTPVIMNLSRMNDREARRMVDFAAGLIFGLDGTIEKIDGRVFLLSPKSVEVAPAESSPSHTRGLFD